MTERDQQLKQAYQQLDDAVRKIATLEITPTGMVSDWVVSVGLLAYDDEGNMESTVEPILPEEGRVTPLYRITGLLDGLLNKYRAIDAHNLMIAIHDDDDEGDK